MRIYKGPQFCIMYYIFFSRRPLLCRVLWQYDNWRAIEQHLRIFMLLFLAHDIARARLPDNYWNRDCPGIRMPERVKFYTNHKRIRGTAYREGCLLYDYASNDLLAAVYFQPNRARCA